MISECLLDFGEVETPRCVYSLTLLLVPSHTKSLGFSRVTYFLSFRYG